MAKSADAFRTISEVAEWLSIQAHVLRFWESKFTQVKPVKRAGGRRYYRPGDMLLLGGIKKLLYEDGLTIKGVQKILREEGMSHVSQMSEPLDELTLSEIGDATPVVEKPASKLAQPPEEPRGVVLSFENPSTEDAAQAETVEIIEDKTPAPSKAEPVDAQPASAEPEPDAATAPETQQEETPAPESVEPLETKIDAPVAKEAVQDTPPAQTAVSNDAETDTPAEEDTTAALPSFMRRATPEAEPRDAPTPPAPEAETETLPEPQAEAQPEPEPKPEPAAPKPRQIDLPPLTPEAEITAEPGILTAIYRTRQITATQATDIAPLLARLTAHRDSMSASRNGATQQPKS
jgi:DNA-binding transcriptional MerR regulator